MTRRRRFVVGLTGGLASGKSLALETFRRAGAAAIDLDGLAREATRPGAPLARRIAAAFGPGVLDPGGDLDRAALARRAFGDAALRRRLERLVHPAVRRAMRGRLARARGVVVVDVPLLFEKGRGGLAREFDATLLVTAGRAARLRRAVARGMTAADARRRMAAQLPDPAKAPLADVVVPNAGTRADFTRRIRAYYEAFRLICHGG